MSLFPASKSVHTTLPIGRAVPVYSLDMNAGDHLKLDVSQVTRFLTLKQPVMQDYDVELGAFYVPYVAFDSFQQGLNALQYDFPSATARFRNTLNARNFFNPATNSIDRVHPASYDLKFVTDGGRINPIGSIWDHLGYSIASPDPTQVSIGPARNSSILLSDMLSFEALPVDTSADVGHNDYGIPEFYSSDLGSSADDFGSIRIPNFFRWLKYYTDFGMYLNLGAISGEFSDGDSIISDSVRYPDFVTLAHYVYGIAPQCFVDMGLTQLAPAERSWESLFGGTSVEEIQERYINFVLGKVAVATSNPTANSIRFLAYMQIYADWFINQQYTPRSEFIDWVGCAYNAKIIDPSLNWSACWSTSNKRYLAGSLPNQLSYFYNFVRDGECLPVLWSGDNFNSIIKNETLGGVGTSTGSTIESHLYNRVYAKFKDVINRLGPDYRQNSKAVYGVRPSDSTLYRSQVIGFRKFSVAIGDVQQTSQSSATSKLGDFAGFAVSRGNMGKFEWTADEHGIVMVLAWIRPKGVAIVGQVDRSIFKSDYFDYLLPHFGGVGYTDVQEREVNSNKGTSTLSIGKRERYYEYMLPVNEVHGQMRTSMKYLNADRYFIDTPNPNNYQMGQFLYMGDKADLMRVFEDETSTDPVAMCLYFDGDVTRFLPATIRTDF